MPLVILAGLPHPISGAVANAIKVKLGPLMKVIHQPSGGRDKDKELYRQSVTELLKAVTDYAVKRLKAEPPPPTPTRILLAYVPAADEERLLQAFDFFVFPIRLNQLAEYDHGIQNRHRLDLAEKYAVLSLQMGLTAFMEIKSRLSTPGGAEPLFLPPRNFNVSKTTLMADEFLQIRKGEKWAQSLQSVRTKKMNQREVCIDDRNLFFPTDKSKHGPQRDLLPDCSLDDRKRFIQSIFRFGVRLQIDGLHHDVQFEGRNLGGAIFECSEKGALKLDCTHANVYPNDHVRPG